MGAVPSEYDPASSDNDHASSDDQASFDDSAALYYEHPPRQPISTTDFDLVLSQCWIPLFQYRRMIWIGIFVPRKVSQTSLMQSHP